FEELPVRQNIQIALQRRFSDAKRGVEEDRLLTLLNLAADSGKLAGALSHGQQQWLEIGMALALQPQLLLLDEPTAGMSPEETFRTGELIKSFNAEGMTVLVSSTIWRSCARSPSASRYFISERSSRA